jgi:5-methylcytosine-specific restriction endonuclease McrA
MSGRWQGSTRARRLPANWVTIRSAILRRDGNRCQIRGPRCTGTANEVDHIQVGDDHRTQNLQAACTQCHRDKTQAEAKAARPRRARTPEPHPGLRHAP